MSYEYNQEKRRSEQAASDARIERVFAPTPGTEIELRGEIDFVRVVNERTGWGFAKLYVSTFGTKAFESGAHVPLTGFVSELFDTAIVDALGVWNKHVKFGWQVALTYAHVELPSTAGGVAAWLEDRFDDIGPMRARAIVTTFPPPTIWDILEKTPERLCEVEGVGEKIAEGVARAYQIHKHERESFVALAALGLKAEQIRAAVALWRADAVRKLTENPYELRRLPGIGWKQADVLARRQGIRRDDVRRIIEGLRYALEEAEHEGHTCRSRKKAISIAAGADILGLGLNVVAAAFDTAVAQGALVENADDFYRPETAFAEETVAQRVAAFLAASEAS